MDSEALGNDHNNNGHGNAVIVCETANDSIVAEDQLTHCADELTGAQRSLSH